MKKHLITLIVSVAVLFFAAAPGAQQGAVSTLPSIYIDSVTGMEFLLVRGGCYEMGDTLGGGDGDEQPHPVCVNDFYIGKHEVTNDQFAKFIAATGYRTTAETSGSGWGLAKDGPGKWQKRSGLNWKHPIWPGDSISKKGTHPVVQVSWHDAVEFAKWLTEGNNRSFRLPTEAEWEYAARGGGKPYLYSWGNGSPSGNVADKRLKKVFRDMDAFDRYDDGYKYTAPVGSFPSNDLGLYDMTGNVWEWCGDWFDKRYYEESPRMNPRGPAAGLTKVDRGGAWNSMPRIARVSNRDDADPEYRFFNVGFRLVLPVR